MKGLKSGNEYLSIYFEDNTVKIVIPDLTVNSALSISDNNIFRFAINYEITDYPGYITTEEGEILMTETDEILIR